MTKYEWREAESVREAQPDREQAVCESLPSVEEQLTSARPDSLLDRWILLAMALYSLSLVTWLLRGHVHVTAEDGYYYYKIAQEIASGAGSTFDGLHLTNGYHPLWLLCLTLVFRVTSQPEAALTLGVLLQGIFLALTGVVVYQSARLTIGRTAAIFAALVWLHLTYVQALSGLEFSLHALTLVTTAYLYLRWRSGVGSARAIPAFALGALLSLTFLARLETLLLAGILGLFLLARERQEGWTRGSISRLLRFALPVTITVLVYVGFNLWMFGHPLPISGVIKHDWSRYLLEHDPLYEAHGWLAAKAMQVLWPLGHLRGTFSLVIGVYLVPIVFLIGNRARMGSRQDWRHYAPFVLYSVLQFVGTALLYHGDLSFKPWYYIVQPWLTALLAGGLLEAVVSFQRQRQDAKDPSPIGNKARRTVALACACLVPLLTLRTVAQWQTREQSPHFRDPLRDAALWARANLSPDTVLGAWNAGTISYLSQRRVVNLDGLVNSWDYYQTDRHDLCRYWRKAGITYLVDAFQQGQALSRVPTMDAYASCAGRLEPVWSSDRYGAPWRMEAYRIPPPDDSRLQAQRALPEKIQKP